MAEDPEKEPYLAPSSDSRKENLKKARAGRGLVVFIVGLGCLAFFLYLFIVIYGTMKAN